MHAANVTGNLIPANLDHGKVVIITKHVKLET